ncbi:flagellar biosynthesis protein FlhA [Sphingobium xanthum]|jgi:flagellar biosynthesis protein FlhA|uniref:flagellar biosynthesis protein FlhA n=1 Tax=Sphingobium xanthum TaxID=1387165 RepID=UPI001C8B922B|nr:flagellar biosynthesis protein FlhA [Sphingobium xanthum]
MTRSDVNGKIWSRTAKGAAMPLAILAVVMFMMVPVPAIMLDIGFVTNIMISLAVVMIALNAAKPLDFSSFPTVLLFATLLRLALNVASTRVVLVDGHTGSDAAGHVIEAFGNFMIGGDYVVGIFVFAILMIINLMVITKGAGRVSEVSARFTLDAMPGKQMAIDADLNAGLLTAEEAKLRRAEIATEADFYGSMDGASKFVKGDAVAGILILVINIVGGIILGVVSHGLDIGQAAQTYVLLAIGDALVAQVPALLLSIAAAAIVTRVKSEDDLGGQISSQFSVGKAWFPVAGILTFLGVLPGMPHMIILPAAGISWFIALKLRKASQVAAEVPAEMPVPENPAHIEWADVSDGAVLGLEIGYGLINLVDERKDAPLIGRITGIRRQLSRELGFVVPMIRVKDNLALGANQYRITIAGAVVGEDEIWPEELLALDSGDLTGTIAGRRAMDPTFGLEAVWIDTSMRSEAVVAGYTVVDPSTVVATHLNHLIVNNAAEMFGMDEAKKLLDTLKEVAPQLADGLTPQPLTLAQVTALCRLLLAEGIPLKDFRRIAEAMVAVARPDMSVDLLCEAVRQKIGSLIIQNIVPVKMPLPVITLDGELEGLLAQAMRVAGDSQHPIEPALGQRLIEQVSAAAQPLMAQARSFAIVTSPVARRALARLFKPHLPETPVLSFLEIPDGKPVEVVAVVGNESRINRVERLAA